MADSQKTQTGAQADPFDRQRYGQVVLVFQGGGALGAYQAGVYQALHEHGVEPDWVIGTSIGAINAALIAGNAPENRLDRLREFWNRMRHSHAVQAFGGVPYIGAQMAHGLTMLSGVQSFFQPNPLAWLGLQTPLGAESAAYYQTRPLEKTLGELIDLDLLNAGAPRLTVGAAQVQTGDMHYFDSRDAPLNLKHIMASGALPPAFPAVRIDGELYWDGGILSNTPVEAVFDDNPRRNGLVFAVHIWNPSGPEPDSLWTVMNRQKDLQYTSRAASHIKRQKQIHKLRHVIAELARKVPEADRNDPAVRELAGYGCLTQMHVVRLLAQPLKGEDHLKDIDFSPSGIQARWEAGYADTLRVLAKAAWTAPHHDPLDGFILHEAQAGKMMPEHD
ncbi:MAG: patatin-like phospholipase family protein [Asticcacaulis sp.]|nr:patatin-like phospholipase family protein [Asticcacaulis sp.]